MAEYTGSSFISQPVQEALDDKVSVEGVGTIGQVLTSGGVGGENTWETPSTVAVGGSNGQIQYNSSGALGGDVNMAYNSVTGETTLKNLAIGLNGNLAGKIRFENSSVILNGGPNTQVQTDLNKCVLQGFNTGINIGLGVSGVLAIGEGAAFQSVAQSVICIGQSAGYSGSAYNSVSIGNGANTSTSGQASIALGPSSTSGGLQSVAVGNTATSAGIHAIAVGVGANASGLEGVAIGSGTLATTPYSVAVGYNAGKTAGDNALHLGTLAGFSALTPTKYANNIILNATGSSLITTQTNSLIVKPMRDVTTDYVADPTQFKTMKYNPTTGEIGYITI